MVSRETTGHQMETILTAEHLTHHYGDQPALNDISFEMREGEIFGLVGPNGSGKTTTVRLLNGMFPPSAGQMRVMGLDPTRHGEQVRQQTGVLTETPALYERLTAHQNLEFFATLCMMPRQERGARIDELLSFFELEDRTDDKVSTFSKGMKQRLALARALLHQPKILFLDEPTSALDPEASAQVRELIVSIGRQDSRSVLVCTHILSEAERLCDRVAILGKGRLLALGSLDELRRRVMPGLWVQVDLLGDVPPGLGTHLSVLEGVQTVETKSDSLRLKVSEESVVPIIADAVVAAGGRLLRLTPQEITLEEVYFALQNQANGGSHAS
jgi:ABC-2 type transport system ATP-binding protein